MANPIHDQWDAAAEDARRRLHNTVLAGGGVSAPPEIEISEETVENDPRAKMLAHVIGHYTDSDGAKAACPHVGDAPGVMFGAACWTGQVFCHECFKMAWRIYEGFYNRMGQFTPCDNCHGKPCPGNVEGSSTGVVNYGPIMLTISLCAECTLTKLEGGD